MISSDRIQTLTNDREAFSAEVYSTLEQALAELQKREADPKLDAYIEKSLPCGLPQVMQGKKSMVLFRHIATPNHEINRFISFGDALDSLQTLILEYGDDKFNDRNEAKYFLGKLRFHKGRSKDGKAIFENTGVLNFNENGNKPLSEISTHWGQNLIHFHHELFEDCYKNRANIAVFDVSSWLHTCGATAKNYYKPFLTLFLRDAILFENFMVEAKEKSFIEQVILPAFLEIEEESGYKPLVVPLAPTEIETDHFWYSYPHSLKEKVDSKVQNKSG